MRISKGMATWMRIIGALLILVGVGTAAPALIPPGKKMAAAFGDTTQAWMNPSHTLGVAGLCLLLAITLIIIGSLADNDPDI
jgi:hypothetical protein